ncbi:hypothetical protein CPB86DRAFT_789802 [Serendipita vermifera]|nr:hypothetical protein CPB86DRAFT_789802 [Serendipita vermifera]
MEEVGSYEENMFPGFRKTDEPVPVWLQRVVTTSVTRFDPQIVQDKFNEIDNGRRVAEKHFQKVCLDLHDWATARPTAEHSRALKDLDGKLERAQMESMEQERLRQNLLRFAQMVRDALGLLLSVRKSNMERPEFGRSTTQNGKGTGQRNPVVLVPDSSQGVYE